MRKCSWLSIDTFGYLPQRSISTITDVKAVTLGHLRYQHFSKYKLRNKNSQSHADGAAASIFFADVAAAEGFVAYPHCYSIQLEKVLHYSAP